jgi:hypothetical protein
VISTLAGLIFLCIIAGFLFWAAQKLMSLVTVAEPFRTFIQILLAGIVLVVVLYALTILLGMEGIHVPNFGFGQFK